MLAIDGLALDNDRTQQDTECARVADGATCIGWDVPIKGLFQADPLDEVIDDG